MKNNAFTLALFCLVLFLASACKTDTKVEDNTTTVKKETTVIMRQRAEPSKLNPMLVTDGFSLQVCYYMFPTLLDYDPFTLKLSPVLVKARPGIEEITSGERAGWAKYTFDILEEATWDDGSPVTGEDYLFTIKTLFNPHVAAAPYRGYLDLIKDVELYPDNPKKFSVYTSEKYIKAEYATGLFIYPEYKYDSAKVMRNYEFSDIRNPKLAEQYKDDEKLKEYGTLFNSPEFSRNKDMVGGCGAYRLEEWVDGEQIVLVKKDNWWGDKMKAEYPMLTALPKRLVFKPISDATTALTMMKNEELDVITLIPDEQFIEFRETEIAKKSFNLHTPPYFGYTYYGFNTKNPKLSDKRVRQAVTHLVDIDEIIKSVKPFAEPVIGPFHPTRSYYHKGLEPRKLDVEKAKKLLAEAGWKDSNNNGTVDKILDGELVELELELLITPNAKVSASMGLIFQNEAKKAGVRINVVEKDNSALVGQLRAREFDIFARGAGAEVSIDDPMQYWHTSSDSPNGANRFGFGNTVSDKLIEKIRTELDQTKRDALFRELQEIMYDEQPAVFLYATKDRVAINKKFKGVETTIKTPGYYANYWYE